MTATSAPGGSRPYRLEDQLGEAPARVTMTGVLALLRAPLDVCRQDAADGFRAGGVVCGYRGSPLGTVDTTYESHRGVFEANGLRFVNGVNEELAATVLWGAQQALLSPNCTVDRVVGLWYAKGPGLDRAGDAIRHATISGVPSTGGVVLAVGDDPECKSSTVPSSTEYTLADLAVPTLQPSTVQEVLDLGRHAYAISRRSGSWVGLKIHADVADGYGTVDVGVPLPDVPPFERDGRPFSAMVDDRLFAPYSVELEHEALTTRLDAVHHYVRHAGVDQLLGGADATLGIVAAGKLYGDTVAALASLGIGLDDLAGLGLRLYKPALVWPLEPHGLQAFAAGLREIVVVEEKRPFVEDQIRALLYGQADAPLVVGKRAVFPMGGALDVDTVAAALRARLEPHVGPAQLRRPRIPLAVRGIDLPARTPYFCSGCPHNRSTVVPEGSVAAGGIGCHGMALFTRGRATGTTQMGGEGAQWVGTAMFTSEPHRFQNMGDGTLAHSGFLAIRQAVAAGSTITFKVLVNGVVAMTGGQHAAGELPVPALTRQLQAEGVTRIEVITDDPKRYGKGLARGVGVHGRKHLDRVQRELRDTPGVTVLLYDQACAAELRRDRKRGRAPTPSVRPMINQAVCDGCGDCGDVSNCLSVHPVDTPLGRKTRIHQESCNLDMSCIEGNCPSFLTVEVRGGPEVSAAPDVPDTDLPEPDRPTAAAVLIAGVGGTGVVTVAQVLATAANIDGFAVSSVDQTGMAQKGGPVVSHLRIGDEAMTGAARVERGGADAFLVFDLLTALGPAVLGRLDPDRTVVVASTSSTPTGAMVADVERADHPPVAVLRERLDERSRSGSNLYLDAEAVARDALGSSPASNFVVVGAAYQVGLLPVSASAVEAALELNGVAVDANVAAFRLGRRLVAGPEVGTSTAASEPPPLDGEAAQLVELVPRDADLDEVLAWRVPELIGFQDTRYARRYVDVVARARRVELRTDDPSSSYSTVVAERLFQLMAYKDEYEVARLHRAPALDEEVARTFGADAKVTYLLQPPMASRLGLRRKLRLGRRRARAAFWVLTKMKRLRGTPFDPFGLTAERRAERALIDEYVALVQGLEPLVEAGRRDDAIRIAALVSMVRGFAEVKARNLERYRRVLVEELEGDLRVNEFENTRGRT